jgi:hypothetical protein
LTSSSTAARARFASSSVTRARMRKQCNPTSTLNQPMPRPSSSNCGSRRPPRPRPSSPRPRRRDAPRARHKRCKTFPTITRRRRSSRATARRVASRRRPTPRALECVVESSLIVASFAAPTTSLSRIAHAPMMRDYIFFRFAVAVRACARETDELGVEECGASPGARATRHAKRLRRPGRHASYSKKL